MSRPGVSLSTFLAAFLAYAFLFDAMLAYAVYNALFELRGVSLADIGVLLAFWSVTAILFELPSGALSDHFDRRWLMVAAPLCKCLTFALWAIADGNFWLYGLGFLFWSVGQALQSGTREALLYEHLDAAGRAGDYDRQLGRTTAAESLGIAFGSLLGGFVAEWSLDATLWLSLPPLLLASLCALPLVDLRRGHGSEADESAGSYLGHFRDAAREFGRNADLRFVAAYIAVGLIAFDILDEFDHLFFLAVHLPFWAFGVVAAAALGGHAAVSLLAHRLGGQPWLAWGLPLAGGALLVVSSFGGHPLMVLPAQLAYVVVAPASILANARFQQLMEGKSRATTTSALVVLQNISGVALTLGFGYLAEAFGILPAYGWAGVAMLPVVAWVILKQRAGRVAMSGNGPLEAVDL